ncbi:MAG: biotin/lipoyl-binding protein, partial [Campylobacterota bacterium]|nr:biotin/lipoyl-binding protein [Campylobacterota bacterium]
MGVYKMMKQSGILFAGKKVLIGLLLIGNLYAQSIYATFDVEAKNSANVAFSSSGIVDEVSVDIGVVVKKGDILATLKADDLKALLKVHNTTLKFAKKDFDRQVKIKNIIDEAKFDSYSQKYESAKAQVLYQKALLEKTILKAPFDAIVVSKELESGDVVSGQMIKTAFKVQSIQTRKLVLKFDQKYHSIVKVGD